MDKTKKSTEEQNERNAKIIQARLKRGEKVNIFPVKEVKNK